MLVFRGVGGERRFGEGRDSNGLVVVGVWFLLKFLGVILQ